MSMTNSIASLIKAWEIGEKPYHRLSLFKAFFASLSLARLVQGDESVFNYGKCIIYLQ